MRKFNRWLAVKITVAVSTMWAFYLFLIYGLMPVVFPQYTDKFLYWGNVVQLVFLPLLSVGAAVMGRAKERQDAETHDAVMQELANQRDLVKYLHQRLDEKEAD